MSELNWQHETRNVPEGPLEIEREATAEERAAVAAALSLPALTRLAARYAVQRQSRGRYRVQGNIEADVEQNCVVTLDPVQSTVREPFVVEFWPADEIPDETPPADAEALEPDVPEPIDNGRIDVGRIIVETVSASLDPYPRKAGVTFDWQDNANGGEAGSESGPFASLARLKDQD